MCIFARSVTSDPEVFGETACLYSTQDQTKRLDFMQASLQNFELPKLVCTF